MRAVFAVDKPQDIEMTLTVTMPLRQWRDLQAQLDSKYPSWKLSAAITEMVLAAQKHFSETKEREL